MTHDELLRIIEQAAKEEWTSLDLSNQGLTELPPEIWELTNLTALRLRYNQFTTLPPNITNLTNLTHLDLGGNQLSTFPPEIGNLTNLTWLFLKDNRLVTLPPELWHLTNLTRLELGNNQLIILPPEIGELKNLTRLNLEENNLSFLPSEIGNLKCLKLFELGNNKLTTIPHEIGELTNLLRLDLRNNQLTMLPFEIRKLTKLTHLDLRGNLLPIPDNILANRREPDKAINYYLRVQSKVEQKTLSPRYVRESKEKTLDLSNRDLASLSPEIWEYDNPIELNLKKNQLSTLPPEIGRLRSLERLTLQNNRLRTLPAEIGNLENLLSLRLGGNQLTTLPSEIQNFKNIVSLDLEYNELSILPREFRELTTLKRLYLKHNQFSIFPPEILTLRNLTRLELGYNQFTTLPHEITDLLHLKQLELQNNQLSTLPSEIRNLPNLIFLNLRGNPLPIPPEILELTDQPQKILNYYFQHQQAQKKPLNEAKVVIVGQGAVGKTSLVKRLLEDKFDPYETKTEGININRWNVNVPSTSAFSPELDEGSEPTEVRLNVWDFGGQEIMHATHQFFLTKRSLYLLVLDSRLDEQNNRVEYWLKIIQSFGGESPILVVCNKCDEHDLELNWKGLQEKYPRITDFAKRVSCKTGEGIAELRSLIEAEVGQLEHIHDELLLTWFAVKTRLEQMEEDYISYSTYQQMCEAEEVSDELSQQTLLGFLHDLGIVLSFRDRYTFEETNVLNPEWVTKGIYQILNSNELFQSKGILERRALNHILDPQAYPRSKHQFIIDMMRKFELCFDFAESAGERFLVPDLLSKEEPFVGEWDESLAFQYHYDILPGSVISRFIVRMHAYIFKKTYWRNGVVLAAPDGNNKALVKADVEDKKVFIAISGKPETRSTFLAIIRADFDRIHKSISKLSVKEVIPLPGHPDVHIDYADLLKLRERGMTTYFYPKIDDVIDVNQLLDGLEPAGNFPNASRSIEIKGSNLPFELSQQISDFLISLPNLHDTTAQRAFIFSAGLDAHLHGQLPFGTPAAQFIQVLISTLSNYGRLADGRHALEAVLRGAQQYVGQDQKAYCEKLIKAIRNA